jgi:hypothetical protein
MADQPTVEEFEHRIRRDTDHFGGKLPERTVLVWYGYLAALIEWGLISVPEHQQLCKMLPRMEDNPATTILLGRED